MALGPDHQFPFGKPINENDKGGLYAGFRTVKASRVGIMRFGTLVSWVAGTPREMAALATTMRTSVYRDFGRLPYDKSTLPVRVVANKSQGVIELYLPEETDMLVANPEMWLALAEEMLLAVNRFAVN